MSNQKQIIVKESKDKERRKPGRARFYISVRADAIKVAGDKNQVGKSRRFFHTKEEAEAEAMKLNGQQIAGGIITAHPEKSVGRAIDDFIKKSDGREDRRNISAGQLANVTSGALSWKTLLVDGVPFSELQCMDVTAAQIEELLEDNFRNSKTGERLAHNTIKNKLDPLKKIFDLAVKNRWCVDNVARMVDFEEVKYKGLDAAETSQLSRIDLDQINNVIDLSFKLNKRSDAMALAFACWTGLRSGEMRALKWKHILWDRTETCKRTGKKIYAPAAHVKVAMRKQRGGEVSADIPKKTKNGKDSKVIRMVFLLPTLVAWLKAWKLETPFAGDDDYVFPMDDGTSHKDTKYWRESVLHPICNIVGMYMVDDEAPGFRVVDNNNNSSAPASFALDETLPSQFKKKYMRWHDLRHVFASLALHVLGNDLVRVADLMGHQTVDTTRQLYGHWIEDVARDAADAEKMEAKIWRGQQPFNPWLQQVA